MTIKITNNAYSTLSGNITNVATTLSVQAGHGARFPTLVSGEYFYATLIDSSNNLEIIKVTARSTDTFTMTRGAEGTTNRAYTSGDRIELRITAGTITDFAAGTLSPAVASAGAVTLQAGALTHITGTTTITDIDFTPANDGAWAMVIFDGILTLTHHSTTLKLPGGANKTTAAGDRAIFVQDSTDNVSCMSYETTAAVVSAVLPEGMIVPFGGVDANLPAKWLLCYGQNVSRTTYAALFTAISTTHGVGDGSTTFGLPDLRGRVAAGQDDMGGSSANRLTSPLNGDTLGAAGGAESVTLTTTEMPAHTHGNGMGPLIYSAYSAGSNHPNGAGNTSSAGSGGAHANVQPTIILNYIIYAGV